MRVASNYGERPPSNCMDVLSREGRPEFIFIFVTLPSKSGIQGRFSRKDPSFDLLHDLCTLVTNGTPSSQGIL